MLKVRVNAMSTPINRPTGLGSFVRVGFRLCDEVGYPSFGSRLRGLQIGFLRRFLSSYLKPLGSFPGRSGPYGETVV
jgi:hypothetical protein